MLNLISQHEAQCATVTIGQEAKITAFGAVYCAKVLGRVAREDGRVDVHLDTRIHRDDVSHIGHAPVRGVISSILTLEAIELQTERHHEQHR